MTLSIVTPLWGTDEEFVATAVRAMDKVLALDVDQIVTTWKIVIDGDPRDLSSALAFLSPQHRSRVSVLRLRHHQGLSKAKNIALQECNSEYVTWYDADDSVDPPTYLEYLRFAIDTLAKNHSCVSVFSSHWDCAQNLQPIVLRDSSKLFTLHKRLAHSTSDPALYIDFTYHAQVLRYRDFVDAGGFSGPSDIGEDVRLTHRLMRLSRYSYLEYSQLAPYLYRRNPNGITRSRAAELRRISTDDFRSLQAAAGVPGHDTTEHRRASVRFKKEIVGVIRPHHALPEYNVYLPESPFGLEWLEMENET